MFRWNDRERRKLTKQAGSFPENSSRLNQESFKPALTTESSRLHCVLKSFSRQALQGNLKEMLKTFSLFS
jgi:hypothetical protein